MTSAFGGQHSIQLSYGCVYFRSHRDIAQAPQKANGAKAYWLKAFISR